MYACHLHVHACRSIVLHRTRFDAREEDFYEALYTQSRASFGAYVSAGTLLNNYAHIFDLVGDAMQSSILSTLTSLAVHPWSLVVHCTAPCTSSTTLGDTSQLVTDAK